MVCFALLSRDVDWNIWLCFVYISGDELHLDLDTITTNDVEIALRHTKPSAHGLKAKYLEWQKNFESVWNILSDTNCDIYLYVYAYMCESRVLRYEWSLLYCIKVKKLPVMLLASAWYEFHMVPHNAFFIYWNTIWTKIQSIIAYTVLSLCRVVWVSKETLMKFLSYGSYWGFGKCFETQQWIFPHSLLVNSRGGYSVRFRVGMLLTARRLETLQGSKRGV